MGNSAHQFSHCVDSERNAHTLQFSHLCGSDAPACSCYSAYMCTAQLKICNKCNGRAANSKGCGHSVENGDGQEIPLVSLESAIPSLQKAREKAAKKGGGDGILSVQTATQASTGADGDAAAGQEVGDCSSDEEDPTWDGDGQATAQVDSVHLQSKVPCRVHFQSDMPETAPSQPRELPSGGEAATKIVEPVLAEACENGEGPSRRPSRPSLDHAEPVARSGGDVCEAGPSASQDLNQKLANMQRNLKALLQEQEGLIDNFAQGECRALKGHGVGLREETDFSMDSECRRILNIDRRDSVGGVESAEFNHSSSRTAPCRVVLGEASETSPDIKAQRGFPAML